MSNDNKIMSMENEIKKLKFELDKQNKIVERTKEYLFILENENEKKTIEIKRIETDFTTQLNKQEEFHNNEVNILKIENNNYKNEIKLLEKENEDLKNEIELLKSTLSWKITTPLLKLKNLK